MRILIGFLVLLMSGVIVGGLALLFIMDHYSKDLPDYQQLANHEPAHTTRLYAANGLLLEEYATENRVFLPISAIPKRVRGAFIAAEDSNFYENPGVDIRGIMRAVMTNIANYGKGRALVGGSTITQQVVKNFLLTNEKSFERKIKEAILAFRITRTFSKDKILELYLNEIYLGYGSYGVGAAANNYFNRSIDELSVAESAFLASLPKAPAHYNPKNHYERAIARRNWVISRMRDDGYITAEEAEQAVATPIILRQRDATEVASAVNFAEEVRRKIIDDYGSDKLYKGGLTVHTTLVPEYQQVAETALRHGISAYERRHGYKGPLVHVKSTKEWLKTLQGIEKPKGAEHWKLAMVTAVSRNEAGIGLQEGGLGRIALNDILWARQRLDEGLTGAAVGKVSDVLRKGDVILVANAPEDVGDDRYYLRQVPDANGAVVMMDPHTGRVLAMVGGLPHRNIEFNRATQAKRQPGSSFKPFVYLAAMENGFTPASIVIDAPIELPQGPDLPLWKPQNYSGEYYGPSTLRRGLEKSYNVMTVRLAQMLGMHRIQEVGQRFGIYDELPQIYSVVLGAHETTLLRLTSAYAMLVNGGKRIHPVMVERIQNREGKLVYRSDTRECPNCSHPSEARMVSETVPEVVDDREQITDPRSAYQVVAMLEGVVKRGTGVKARAIGKPVAGKTGTTNDNVDSWFIGFTPDLVIGVYTGFDTPRTLGLKETGASVALPVFVEAMETALEDQPSTPFRIPSGIKLVKIDRQSGMLPSFETPGNQVIFEAFKTGTEPTSSAPVIGGYGGYGNTYTPGAQPGNGGGSRPTLGTGGLY